jgi:hypothetical protein
MQAWHERMRNLATQDSLATAERDMTGETHTLEDSDSRGEVVDTPGSAESGGDDGGGGNEIVGEAVVQVTLCSSQMHVLAKSEDAAQVVSPRSSNVPGARKHR